MGVHQSRDTGEAREVVPRRDLLREQDVIAEFLAEEIDLGDLAVARIISQGQVEIVPARRLQIRVADRDARVAELTRNLLPSPAARPWAVRCLRSVHASRAE